MLSLKRAEAIIVTNKTWRISFTVQAKVRSINKTNLAQRNFAPTDRFASPPPGWCLFVAISLSSTAHHSTIIPTFLTLMAHLQLYSQPLASFPSDLRTCVGPKHPAWPQSLALRFSVQHQSLAPRESGAASCDVVHSCDARTSSGRQNAPGKGLPVFLLCSWWS